VNWDLEGWIIGIKTENISKEVPHLGEVKEELKVGL